MQLGKYSFGTGDRFGRQGVAQLRALIRAKDYGIDLIPVWNKSNREHQIIGTSPSDVRIEADQSVKLLAYDGPYFVDADHINSDTFRRFVEPSDFFTLDVAAYIGKSADQDLLQKFRGLLEPLTGTLNVKGLFEPLVLTKSTLDSILQNYLLAVLEAGKLYRKIVSLKGEYRFIAEVSMDEVPTPQTPLELLVILKLLAIESVPVQTIAPKFSGRFNKGVDYVGDTSNFRTEFEADLLVINHAIEEFGLPGDLKLSIHSGSDKFSIYPIIGEMIRKYDTGIHIKTAGTTWLEEVIGLALGDTESLEMVKDIYHEALSRQAGLCAPYADVIDINPDQLPADISGWSGVQFSEALLHNPDSQTYNLNMRQLLHVAYKLAAEREQNYLAALDRNKEIISKQVEENIFDRHIRRLFNL